MFFPPFVSKSSSFLIRSCVYGINTTNLLLFFLFFVTHRLKIISLKFSPYKTDLTGKQDLCGLAEKNFMD